MDLRNLSTEELLRLRDQGGADEPGGFGKFLRGAGEFATGIAANIPSWATRTGRRVTDLGAALVPGKKYDPFERASGYLTNVLEDYEKFLAANAPKSLPYSAGRVASEFATEGTTYVAGGGALRAAAAANAARVGGRAGKALTWMGSRSPGVVTEAIKDAASVAPLDIATGIRREESTAGVLADVLPEGRAREFFTDAAGNVVSRVATEALLGFGADVGVRGLGQGVKRIRGAPTGTGFGPEEVVAAGRKFSPEATGRMVARAGAGAAVGGGASAVAGEDPLGGALVGGVAAGAGPAVARKFGVMGREGAALPGKWYSRLEEAIANSPQQTAPARQWKGMLDNIEGGVSKGEREFTGIETLLNEDPERVFTGEELLGHLEEHGIQLSETVRGGTPDDVALRTAEDLKATETYPGFWDVTYKDEQVTNLRATSEEQALRMVRSNVAQDPDGFIATKLYTRGYDEFAPKHTDLKQPGGINYGEITIQYKHEGRTFKSSEAHGDPDDTVIRIRHSDREYVNPDSGNTEKVLFVEEGQSDLHQRGRKSGYGEVASKEAEAKEVVRQMTESHPPGPGVEPGTADHVRTWPEEDRARLHELVATHDNVPDAPFKGADQQVELTLKRIIAKAVEGGYDRVAWVSGKQSAGLYSLSKHVDRLDYDGASVLGYKDGQVVVSRGDVTPENLPEVIGEGPAKRLLEQEGPLRRLEGEDIDIGGEAHQRIYDELWPRTADKNLKALGGVDIEPIRLGGVEEVPEGWSQIRYDEGHASVQDPKGEWWSLEDAQELPEFKSAPTNLSFRITDAMRNTAEAKGFRLMARGGVGAAVGGTAGAVAPAEDEGERFGNIVYGALVGAAAEVVGTPLARKFMKSAGRSSTAKMSSEARAVFDGSPDLQKIDAQIHRGDENLLPDKKPLLTRLQRVRYRLMREVLPLEVLDKLAGGGNRMRDALGRARGNRIDAERAIFVDHIAPMVKKHGEDGMRLGAALAVAERDLELVKNGYKTATAAEIQSLEAARDAAIKSPVARQAADDLREQFRRQLDELHDAGVISDGAYQALVNKGAHYVPLVPEVLNQVENFAQGKGGNLYRPLDRPGVRRMSEGELSHELITDPYTQLIADEFTTKRLVARQRIADVLADHVATGELKGIANKLRRRPKNFWRDDRVIAVNVPHTTKAGKTQPTTYYEIINDDVHDAWSSFNSGMSKDALIRSSNAMRRFMQAGVTLRPTFMIKNGIRDFFMSSAQYDLLEGVPVAEKVVQKFGTGRTLATTAGTGAAVGAGTAEEGERVEGALKGAVYATAGVGAAHMGAHAARTVDAMLDIIGPDAMGMLGGGMYGYVTGDDENTFAENLGRFVVGAAAGRAVGFSARKAGLLKGDPEQYARFQRDGAGQFGLYDDAKSNTPAHMLEQLKKMGVDPGDVMNPHGWGHAVEMILHPFTAIRTASSAIETAPRLAFYKRQIKRGMQAAGGVPTKAQSEEITGSAVFGARDLSLDFRIGAGSKVVKHIAAATPFLRPMLLGMDKLGRMLGDPKTVEVAAATIMAPSIALWMLNHSDPDIAQEYNDRPEHEKNTYWLIPKKFSNWNDETQGFWRVPKPFEIGHIFGSIPERVLDDYFAMDDIAASARAAGVLGGVAESIAWTGGSFMSPSLPMPIGPWAQVNMGEHGYDIFRGRPINPYPWRNVENVDQQNPYTSTVALAVARTPVLGKGLAKLGFDTPAKIDFAITGYAGTLGGDVTDMASRVARDRGFDKRPEPIGQRRAFEATFHTRPTTSTQSEIEFRDRFDKVEAAHNSLNQLLAANRNDEVRERFGKGTEGRELVREYYVMRNFKNTIDEFTALRREIRDSGDIPPEERERMVMELNQSMSGIARRSQRAVRKLSETK